jgi:hypothetical protein
MHKGLEVEMFVYSCGNHQLWTFSWANGFKNTSGYRSTCWKRHCTMRLQVPRAFIIPLKLAKQLHADVSVDEKVERQDDAHAAER